MSINFSTSCKNIPSIKMSYFQLAVIASLCALAFSAPLGGGEIPDAFKNLSTDQKQAIGKIFENTALTKDQAKTQMDDYAKTQPQAFQVSFCIHNNTNYLFRLHILL